MGRPLLLGEAPSRAGDRFYMVPLSGNPAVRICRIMGWDTGGEAAYWTLVEHFETLHRALPLGLSPRDHLRHRARSRALRRAARTGPGLPEGGGVTTAQERYLAEIREAGERSYNGRARKPLEALRQMGYIEYDFTLVPQMNMRFTEQFTARPRSTE